MSGRFHFSAAATLAIGALSVAAARAQEPAGKFIETPTARLWAVDTGEAQRPALVLLHTNTGSVVRWTKQFAAFSAAGYRVIAFDREGWGKSVTKPGAKPTSVAQDLDLVADRLGLKSFYLVGEAGGGYVALDYAAWRPQRVRALVVAASGAGVSDPQMAAFRRGAAIPGFDRAPPQVRELSPTYRGSHPDGVAQWLAIEKTAAPGGAEATILRTPNTIQKIESITAPVLVIAGDVDLTTPVGAIRLWAKHLRNYEFALIPDSGHAVSWEQPQVFDSLVLDFVSRHPM